MNAHDANAARGRAQSRLDTSVLEKLRSPSQNGGNLVTRYFPEPRVAAANELIEIAVQDPCSHLKQQVSATQSQAGLVDARSLTAVSLQSHPAVPVPVVFPQMQTPRGCRCPSQSLNQSSAKPLCATDNPRVRIPHSPISVSRQSHYSVP